MNLSLARFISIVFNPFVILVFAPFFLVYKTTGNFSTSITWTAYTLLFLLILSAIIIFAVKKKIFSDLDVSTRSQRPLLFLVADIFLMMYLLGLFLLRAPFILFIVTFAVILGVFTAAVINTRLKASLHVATLSALLSELAIVYGGKYFLLLLVIPLVGWSRVTLKRHTVSEVIVGGIVGCLLSLVMYGIGETFFHI